MKSPLWTGVALALLAPQCKAQTAQTESTKIFERVKGSQELANVVVDTAPGAVSAIGLLGISGDQVIHVDNPRDLTLAIKPARDGTAIGISFNPARSAIAPMNVSTYHDNTWARVVAGTALGWAQNTSSVNDKSYRQRALSIETSFYLQAGKDDPAMRYWQALEGASKGEPGNPCGPIPAQRPEGEPGSGAGGAQPPAAGAAVKGPVVPKVLGEGGTGQPSVPASGSDQLKAELDQYAEACRKKVLAGARWNASRAWASFVDGRYSPESGSGRSRSLGRSLVLGASWGFGDAGAPRASSVTLAGRRTWDEPTLATLDADSPVFQDSSLVTLRGAYGSATQRVLLEASHLKSNDVTASMRTYKRALGIDLKVGTGTWLILRTGKQRRIDGNGDESGSSVSLSLSPTDLLKF